MENKEIFRKSWKIQADELERSQDKNWIGGEVQLHITIQKRNGFITYP